jgi:hypothetical protein
MFFWAFATFLLVVSTPLQADDPVETFVQIQRVNGNQIAILADAANRRGGGMRGGGARGGGGTRGGRAAAGADPRGAGPGRRGRGEPTEPTILTVPLSTKITSATRERRTFEFRVGTELAGGLNHRIFQEMQAPLSARLVSDGTRLIEINVIIPESDINQSATTARGETVVAVRPKRPPTKSRATRGEAK